jgi:AmiR/NasT family two-component response regulator
MSARPRDAPVLRAFVVHWDAAELAAKVRAVEDAGAKVVGTEAADGARAAKEVQRLAPDVLVVWLARLPSHGRATAGYIRSTAWGRDLPIVLVDQDPEPLPKEKRAKLLEAVPDGLLVTPATLAFWLGKVEKALETRRRPVAAEP